MQPSRESARREQPIADELRQFFELAAESGSPRTCYSVTLYTLSEAAKEPSSVPVATLFSEERHAKHRAYYADADDLLPRLARCGQELSPNALMSALRPEGIAGITMRHAIAATLMYGKGRAIALLALTWDVESLDSKPFVELRRALDEDRGKLNDWFPQLGADFHHVLLLAEDQVGELEALARAASPGEDSDRPFRELCQRYVSAASKDNRSQYLTAVFPSEPNRYQGSVAAVTPGASLLGGQESHIRLSMVLAAAQALADVAALRAIHAVAHAALGRLPTEEGKGRALRDLEYSAQVLRDLELDLGFNVEAQLSIRIRVPILPVEQFYACLLEALGVERSVDMTSAMLARLGKVLDARQAAAAARTARLERAFGTALSAAGGLAIPITIGLAFVGANVSEVRTKTSIFSGHYLIYYLGLGASPVLLGILVWIGVWFRSRSPKRGTADIPTSAY